MKDAEEAGRDPERAVESLAREIHKAVRKAVDRGLVVNRMPYQPCFEWDEITEEAREGKRVQARYLLERGYVDVAKLPPV